MSRISIKGVVIGAITDIVSTTIFAFFLFGYMETRIKLAHMSSDQTQVALLAAMQSNPFVYVSQFIAGMACSVLGGYVGARLSKHDELLNGSLTSFLCLAFGFYALIGTPRTDSLVLLLLGLIASPLLGLLGGYLRLLQKREPNLQVS